MYQQHLGCGCCCCRWSFSSRFAWLCPLCFCYSRLWSGIVPFGLRPCLCLRLGSGLTFGKYVWTRGASWRPLASRLTTCTHPQPQPHQHPASFCLVNYAVGLSCVLDVGSYQILPAAYLLPARLPLLCCCCYWLTSDRQSHLYHPQRSLQQRILWPGGELFECLTHPPRLVAGCLGC